MFLDTFGEAQEYANRRRRIEPAIYDSQRMEESNSTDATRRNRNPADVSIGRS